MIKVVCRSNLDDVMKEDWPHELPCRPMVGDLIQSNTIWINRGYPYHLELKVVSVIFVNALPDNINHEYVLNVELHLPEHRWKSIGDFQSWYYKLRTGALNAYRV